MSKLKKGLKTIKYNKNIILAVALALISAVTVIYAFFSKEEPLYLNYLGSGSIGMIFGGPDSVTSSVFAEPGDTYEAEFSVQNVGGRAFTYKFGFNLSSAGEDYLFENAVLVYFDGEYCGTLYELAYGYDGEYPDYDFVLPLGSAPYLYMEDEAAHTLKLEYHIGGDFLTGAGFELTIDCISRSLTEKNTEFVFVKDLQLSKLLPLINNVDGNIKTVVLCGDAELNDDVTITKGVNIDLNGHTLDLKGKTLTFDFGDEGIYYIYDGKNGGDAGITDSGEGGGIIINTPDAVVLCKSVDLDAGFTVASSAFIEYFTDNIKQMTKYGIAGNFDYIGYFAEYAEYYRVKDYSSSSDDDLVTFADNYIGVVSAPEENTYAALIFGFQKGGTGIVEYVPVDVVVLGETESIIYKIETANKLPFMESAFEDRYLLKGDLFLPKKDKLYCDRIIWISSHPEILTNDGRFIKPYTETDIDLSAVYTVNGQNIVVTYYLTAQSKTIQEKIDEVAGSYGSIYFIDAANLEVGLPLAGHYTEMGFDSFEFYGDANYFEFIDEGGVTTKLRLKASVESLNTYITLRGYIDGEWAESRINVYIDLESSVSVFDAAHRYVRSHLNHIDRHTFDSFPLPSYYLDGQTVITYELKSGQNTIELTQVSYRNPDDVGDYVSIAGMGSQPLYDSFLIDIDKEKVPPRNTQVFIEVTVTYNQESDTRLINFLVTGVLHYGEDIPDINLFHLLRRISDENFDWYITADEAEKITRIPAQWQSRNKTVDFGNNNISSVAGLEYFVNLEEINLNNNFISDISPLSRLYALEKLYINNNGIIDVSPLEMLVNLKELDISFNDVKDIWPLRNLGELTHLYVQNNINLKDFQAIENYGKLKLLNVLNTPGTVSPSERQMNLNYVISAYNAAKDHYTPELPEYYFINTNKWNPQTQDTTANRILSTIDDIYEFSGVLHLPHKIYYNDQLYNVTWNTNFDDIINIDHINGRAYVTQPVSSVDVKLYASIEYSGKQYFRAFNILSRQQKEHQLLIEAEGEAEAQDAFEVIPDSTLRYYLFKHFDTDEDDTITRGEIEENSAAPLNLMGLGIKSIEGLQHFYGVNGDEYGIQILNLQNNFIDDISPLQSIATLRELYLSGYDYDFGILGEMENLMILNVYGCKNLNSAKTLGDLFEIYKKNPSIKIYKDSNSEFWNPYLEPLAMALKSIKGMYALTYNVGQELDAEAQVRFYDGSAAILPLTYTVPSGQSYIRETVGGKAYIRNNTAVTEDKYQYISVSITYQSVSVTARISVIIKAVTGIEVQWHDGTVKKLFDVVKNPRLRERIAALYSGAVITRAQLGGISSLDFDYRDDGLGLKNLEIFYGLNLTSLTINYFAPLRIGGGQSAYIDEPGYIDNVNFPNLTSLAFTYSVVDLYAFDDTFKASLTQLNINNCAYVKLEDNGEHDAFEGFDNLQSLTMINSNIADFTAIEVLDKITYLAIYGNPASASYAADKSVNRVYLNLIGENPSATFTYYVTANNVLWTPQDLSYLNETITDLYVEICDSDEEFIKYAEYGVYNCNYDIMDGYIIRLPRYITVEKEYINLEPQNFAISWTSTAPSTISVPLSAQEIDDKFYYVCAVEAQEATAYVVIKGTVGVINKEIIYAFAVEGTEDPEDYGENIFNIAEFMEDGEFCDPVFVYRALSLVADSDGDGVYYDADLKAVTTMNLSNGSSNSTVYNVIQNIKGLRHFGNVQSLQLQNNNLYDISELYHLTKIQTLQLYNNPIQTLWVDQANGIGVFDRMHNLTNLQMYNCYAINDYMPIAQRKRYDGDDGTADPDTHLGKLATLRIECGSNEITYNAEYNKYAAVIKWWDIREHVSGTTNLYLFRANALVENATRSEISDVIKILEAMESVGDQTVTELDTPLTPSSIVVEGNQMFLTWQFLGSQNIMTIEGNVLKSVTAENYYSNHKIPMKVYVTYYVGTTPHYVGKIVYLNLNLLPHDEFLIEVTEDEYDRYHPNYKYYDLQNDTYYVRADHAVPDGMVMNALFGIVNRNGDHILSISERNNPTSTTLTLSNRAAMDMTGIELFPKLRVLNFSGGRIIKIPDLPIYGDTALYQLNLGSNIFLRDLSGYDYIYDDDDVNYTSLRKKITRLQVNSSSNLNGDQLAGFLKMEDTLLTYLDIRSVYIINYDFLPEQADTLTDFFIGAQFRTFSNGNLEFFRKFYLTTGNLGTSMGIPSSIMADYIKLHENYQEVYVIGENETPLPDRVFIYGKEYGVEWIKVTGQPYDIDEDGIITVYSTENQTITVTARAYFVEDGVTHRTYSEDLTFKIDIEYPDAPPFITEAKLYDENTHLYDYVPDMVLRRIIIAAADANDDGLITETEAQALTSLTINQTVRSLEGIGLFPIITLSIDAAATDDFSPLAGLTQLQTLTISNNRYPVADFGFLSGMNNLTSLTLTNTHYTNLSFTADLEDLVTLANINSAPQDLTLHVRNAIAYARAVNSLAENASGMGGTLSDHTSTADEKEAALILSGIDGYLSQWQQQLYKGFLNISEEEEYLLPDAVSYKGKTYNVEWISLSNLFVIDGYTLSVNENEGYQKSGGLACRVRVDGYAYYYRYWFVSVA